MTKPFSISLKSGERIFINGAVVRVDRKVSIEFLNDVTFLLEAHVMQLEQTTTPFRQLYFIVQTMLIDPGNAVAAKQLFDTSCLNLSTAVGRPELQNALAEARRLVDAKRYYEALKSLRGCFAIEDEILRGAGKARHREEQEH
ncbi:MAG: flagellar biosynthesis repressor FlbT [Rhodomicrobium sp.]